MEKYIKKKNSAKLTKFFTLNNLGALRELSLREVADDMDEKISQTVIEPIGVKEKFSFVYSTVQRQRN